MDCRTVQEEILESLEHAASTDLRQELDAHLAGCPDCAQFAARQRNLDARLSTILAPPQLSPTFRTALKKRIRREGVRIWADSLPDKVHFASCGTVTLVCALLLPFDTLATLGAGAAATVLSYVLLTSVQSSFDDAEDPN